MRHGEVVDIGSGGNHPRLDAMDLVRYPVSTGARLFGAYSNFDDPLAFAGFQCRLDWRPWLCGSAAFCGFSYLGTHRRPVHESVGVGNGGSVNRRVTVTGGTVCTRRDKIAAHLLSSLKPIHHVVFYQPRVSTMASNPQRTKHRDNILSSLNVAIDALNITKDILSATPAKAVCGPVSVILTMVKVSSLLTHVCG